MTLPKSRRGLHSGMRSWSFLLVAFATAVAAPSCSSVKTGQTTNPVGSAGGGGGGTIDTDDSVESCTDDPRVDTYTANLKKAGMGSVLTFTLIQSDPAPPA